jgi:predicted SAM-dependent methyltransferase
MAFWKKLNKYGARYGYASLLPRYIGRRAPRIWLLIGRLVTRPYLRSWVRKDGPRILNLAGADHLIPDTLTADVIAHADAFVDMREPLPFPDLSIDAIFCEEGIEHIAKAPAVALLQECFRVLKPGGAIRISTPDLDYFCARTLGHNDCDEINELFYGHHHHYLYTRAELERAVWKASFTNLKQSSYKDPDSILGRLDSHADRFRHPPEISQYLEAVKPHHA